MNFLKLPTIFILTMLAICSLSSKKLLAAKNDVLSVSKVTQIPTIDGISDDSVWSQTPALIVSVYEVVGKDKGRENFVTMKAIYNQTHICILAEWLDKTKDDTHKSWVWNVEKKTYTKGKDLEDVFSISFPIEGQFTGNMLSPVECTWDVWYWKAARTNPSGYAMDKHHIHTFRQPKGKAKQFPATNKRKSGLLVLQIKEIHQQGIKKNRVLLKEIESISIHLQFQQKVKLMLLPKAFGMMGNGH